MVSWVSSGDARDPCWVVKHDEDRWDSGGVLGCLWMLLPLLQLPAAMTSDAAMATLTPWACWRRGRPPAGVTSVGL